MMLMIAYEAGWMAVSHARLAALHGGATSAGRPDRIRPGTSFIGIIEERGLSVEWRRCNLLCRPPRVGEPRERR